MGDVVELLDVDGRLVRVLASSALVAVGRTLEDGESLLVEHDVHGSKKYVQARLVDDSEVPG